MESRSEINRPSRLRSISLPLLNVLFQQHKEVARLRGAETLGAAPQRQTVWDRRPASLVPPLDTFDVEVAEEYKRQVRAEIVHRKVEHAAMELEDELQQTVHNYSINRAAHTPVANTYGQRECCPCKDHLHDRRCIIGHGVEPLILKHERRNVGAMQSGLPNPSCPRLARSTSLQNLPGASVNSRQHNASGFLESGVSERSAQRILEGRSVIMRPKLRLDTVNLAPMKESNAAEAMESSAKEPVKRDSGTASLQHKKSKIRLHSWTNHPSTSSNEPTSSGKQSSSMIHVPTASRLAEDKEGEGEVVEEEIKEETPPPVPRKNSVRTYNRPRASSARAVMALEAGSKKIKEKRSFSGLLRKSASAFGLGEAAKAAPANGIMAQDEKLTEAKSPGGQLRKKPSIFNLAEAFAAEQPSEKLGRLRKKSSTLFKGILGRKSDE